MRHLDLFSGIGGFALACQWNGIETIGFVEIDKYCQKVLRKHWPNVPIVEDIRDVEKIKEIVANAQSGRQRPSRNTGNYQIQPKDGKNLIKIGNRRIPTNRTGIGTCESPTILVTAGFPCQPFSVAGKQQGERDDRYLWPQTIAVIKAVKPIWVLLENVTGIINLALDTVLSDLEGAGYSYETLIIPACTVNAPHRRDRVWIVANNEQSTSWRGRFTGRSDGQGRKRTPAEPASLQSQNGQAHTSNTKQGSEVVAFPQSRESWEQTEPEGREDSGRGSQENVADTPEQRLHPEEDIAKLERTGSDELDTCQSRSDRRNWWAVEPELGRVAYGIPNRVDRLKCLGNAIVPQVAYEIIKVIKEL